jgi:hypothetical protein
MGNDQIDRAREQMDAAWLTDECQWHHALSSGGCDPDAAQQSQESREVADQHLDPAVL